jgi:hypothetical protein
MYFPNIINKLFLKNATKYDSRSPFLTNRIHNYKIFGKNIKVISLILLYITGIVGNDCSKKYIQHMKSSMGGGGGGGSQVIFCGRY